MTQQEVRIIGAGIVGLAHAWMAAERGHAVTVFERSAHASGASIRNFGMIWPMGQPAGELRLLALRSRERWLRLAQAADVWVNPCGSLHLAHRNDEWEVLREFHAQAAQGDVECSLLGRADVINKSPAANPERLLGGLFSPAELGVNPRSALREIPRWLAREYGVRFEFGMTITQVEPDVLHSADGRHLTFQRVIVCSGADRDTLFPELTHGSDMVLCKLQMLKTPPQPNHWRLGPHLASGLTLRHYRSFQDCPSLPALQERIAVETPELDRYGIHVMASQNDVGEIILGDSHEYDEDIEPFDKSEIDDLILRELRQVLRLPDWTIGQRWHGIYAKSPHAPVFEAEPHPGVHICTGTGGAGMTLAFGLAERAWQRWTS